MAEAIRMPLLSDTMTEGKIVAWHKKVGDKVKSDDVIAEVETDKATMEVMPYVDGTLLYIGVPEGKAAKINGIIAIIGKEGEDYKSLLEEAPKEDAAPKAEDKPAADASKQTTAPQQQPASAAQPQAAPQAKPAPAAVAATTASSQDDDRLKASPLAKKIAKDKGISLAQVQGSGDSGRIIKRDIDNYKPAAAAAGGSKKQPQKPAMPPVQIMSGEEDTYTDMPNSQMRSIIARKLGESKNTAPHFYLNMTLTMDNAIESRKAINDALGIRVSFNDLVIKACAMALQRHPEVNSSWMGDFIRRNNYINIGTAVAVEDGLIVPVIKHADQKSIAQISQEASTLIEKARTKKIQPNEFTGNTFTISNLGMMDIDDFTAIINPPDACILAVGKITPSAVVENGQIVVRQLMKITLSCDHRVVDGAVGAKFLQTLKAHLENPIIMFV